MAIIDKLSPEEFKFSIEKFRSAWNHYFSVYELPEALTNKETLQEKVSIIRKRLSKENETPLISLFDSALNFPEIINVGLVYSDSKNSLGIKSKV